MLFLLQSLESRSEYVLLRVSVLRGRKRRQGEPVILVGGAICVHSLDSEASCIFFSSLCSS